MAAPAVSATAHFKFTMIGQISMTGLRAALKQALAESRTSLANSVRAGRRSLALGTVLVLGSALTVLATTNTPPTITSLNLSSPSVDEGGNITISGAFTDPDATDTHSALIFWPDSTKQKVEIPAGQMTFTATHKLTVRDDDGAQSMSTRAVTIP
jgi:hypothetical protein